MKYTIKVNYSTGDSFSNYDTSTILDYNWTNLDIVKENLKAIQDHYKLYQLYNSPPWDLNKSKIQNMKKNYEKKWWYFDEYSQYFKLDDGTLVRNYNSWVGYFEHLYGAEIISKDDELSFKI